MNDPADMLLDAGHMAALKSSLHQGSTDASHALARWIGKASVVEIDSLEQCPLEEATGLMAAEDEPICFCSVEMNGLLTGELILAFDDASGLALADMLVGQPRGTAQKWTELATSAALETTNILSCSYLNSLFASLSQPGEPTELLPSPPRFSRDFAESLLEFALMGQAIVSDQVLVAQTRFEIDSTALNWTLLLIPDAQSMKHLPRLLRGRESK